MATIKYKDENGQWQEIAIGTGGGSSVEVVDSLDSEDTTAALSANQGRVLKEMIAQSGGGGGSAESPYAMKVFIVPEGVMTATQDAPYTFSAEEAEEFLAQGDFKRTIVKYPTQVLIGMGALNIANLCLYIESDSVQGFICEGTEVTKVSVEANGEMDSAIEYIKTTINCANTPNAIMGYCSISKYYATSKQQHMATIKYKDKVEQ